MLISDAGLRLIAEFEGFSPIPYHDPAGHCTVGYGELLHLGPCTAAELARPPITAEEGRQRLRNKVYAYGAVVERLSRPLLQQEFDALASLAYNIGQGGYERSGVRRAVNHGGDVCGELRKIVTGTNGVVYPGLVRRREAECKMFFGPAPAPPSPPAEEPKMQRLNSIAAFFTGKAFPVGSYLVNVDLDFVTLPSGARSIRVEPFVSPAIGGVLVLRDASGAYAGQVKASERTVQCDVFIGPIADAPLAGARGFRFDIEGAPVTIDQLGIVGWFA